MAVMSRVKPENQLPSWDSYVDRIGRFRTRIVVLVLLGASVGIGIVLMGHSRYSAVSTVELATRPSAVNLSMDGGKEQSITLDTVAALVVSDPLLLSVAEAMGTSQDQAREDLVVTARPLSHVLVVAVHGDSADQAAAGGRAATQTLLGLENELFSLGGDQVAFVRNQVNVLRAQVNARAAGGESSASTEESLAEIESRLQRMTGSMASDSVVAQQLTPKRYETGESVVLIVSGGAAGLLVALLSMVGAGAGGQIATVERLHDRRVNGMRWRPIRMFGIRRRQRRVKLKERSAETGCRPDAR